MWYEKETSINLILLKSNQIKEKREYQIVTINLCRYHQLFHPNYLESTS